MPGARNPVKDIPGMTHVAVAPAMRYHDTVGGMDDRRIPAQGGVALVCLRQWCKVIPNLLGK
jgi:hypothetical protein